jgi:uncharacterized protein YndB with AHSA1/START domain
MSDQNEDLGTIRREGDRFFAELQRELQHSPSAVWAMLTEPGKLVEWLAPGEIEMRIGGRARLNFVDSGIVIDSEVSAFEPNRVIEYSWSGVDEPLRPLRFEIEAVADGSRLTMRLRTPVDEDIARSCAGFEAHLMMLLAALEGVPIKFPFERFVASREAYNAMLEKAA